MLTVGFEKHCYKDISLWSMVRTGQLGVVLELNGVKISNISINFC